MGVVDSHISTVPQLEVPLLYHREPQPLHPQGAAGPYRLAQLVEVVSRPGDFHGTCAVPTRQTAWWLSQPLRATG